MKRDSFRCCKRWTIYFGLFHLFREKLLGLNLILFISWFFYFICNPNPPALFSQNMWVCTRVFVFAMRAYDCVCAHIISHSVCLYACAHDCMYNLCVCALPCVCVCMRYVWGVWVMPIKLGSCIGGLIHVDPSIRDDGW